MATSRYLYSVFLLSLLSSGVVIMADSSYYHIEKMLELTGRQLYMVRARSVIDCARQCESAPNCMSFNYRRGAGECEFNTQAVSKDQLSPNYNSTYGEYMELWAGVSTRHWLQRLWSTFLLRHGDIKSNFGGTYDNSEELVLILNEHNYANFGGTHTIFGGTLPNYNSTYGEYMEWWAARSTRH
jgi:hypothetical protein